MKRRCFASRSESGRERWRGERDFCEFVRKERLSVNAT